MLPVFQQDEGESVIQLDIGHTDHHQHDKDNSLLYAQHLRKHRHDHRHHRGHHEIDLRGGANLYGGSTLDLTSFENNISATPTRARGLRSSASRDLRRGDSGRRELVGRSSSRQNRSTPPRPRWSSTLDLRRRGKHRGHRHLLWASSGASHRIPPSGGYEDIIHTQFPIVFGTVLSAMNRKARPSTS